MNSNVDLRPEYPPGENPTVAELVNYSQDLRYWLDRQRMANGTHCVQRIFDAHPEMLDLRPITYEDLGLPEQEHGKELKR